MVIQWGDTMDEMFHAGIKFSHCIFLQHMSFRYGMTHAVINNYGELLNCSLLHNTFADGYYFRSQNQGLYCDIILI